MTRFRAELVFDYECDESYYGTSDLEEMAKIDEKRFFNNPDFLELVYQLWIENNGKFVVTALKTTSEIPE